MKNKDSSNKFKSSVGLSGVILLIIYNLIILGNFILSFFLYTKKISNLTIGIMLVLEITIFIPLIFYTYYSLESDYLLVFQWPFTRIKIRYADIFEITDEIGDDVKGVYNVCMGKGTIYIGYYSYKYNKKTKKKERRKKYVLLSPYEKDLFLIKMGGKFKRARDIAKQLEEEHQKQFEEHNYKKKIADEKKAIEAEAKKPVDVVIDSIKKTENIVVENEEDE